MSGQTPSADDQPEPGAGWEAYHPPSAPPPGGYGYGPPQPEGHPPYGQPYAPQPSWGYGAVDPVTGQYWSDKSKTLAGLLQVLLPFAGICGVGRLYAGHVGIGLVQLIGFWVSFCASAFIIGIPFALGLWLWSVIDGIVMLTSSDARDAQGRPLRPS